MKRSALFLLIFCNLIWVLNPFMAKNLLQEFSGLQVAWLRYGSAFSVFFLVALVRVGFGGRKWKDYFWRPRATEDFRDLAVLGLGPFFLSPIFQFVGLAHVQAMENSILIAVEPLLTVLLGWIVLSEAMNRDQKISLGLALLGFIFFVGGLGIDVGPVSKFGLLFLLFAQFGESAYSVFSRKLVQKNPPIAVLGSALALGFFALTLVMIAGNFLPSWEHWDAPKIQALIWLGPMGTTLTYLLWAMIAQTVTVPTMALTLFIQPVLGSFVGYEFFGEKLTVVRSGGAILILVAIGFLSWKEMTRVRRSKRKF